MFRDGSSLPRSRSLSLLVMVMVTRPLTLFKPYAWGGLNWWRFLDLLHAYCFAARRAKRLGSHFHLFYFYIFSSLGALGWGREASVVITTCLTLIHNGEKDRGDTENEVWGLVCFYYGKHVKVYVYCLCDYIWNSVVRGHSRAEAVIRPPVSIV